MDERKTAVSNKRRWPWSNPELTDKAGWLAYFAKATVKTDSGCWEWARHRTNMQRGLISIEDRPTQAHRVAYMVFNGEIPGGLFVCHRCDNPACCNPDHLFLGTVTDNNRDAVAKGRASRGKRHSDAIKASVPRGERCGHAKLTEADVIRIRTELSGLSGTELAKMFGVDKSLICSIRKGRVWKHVSSEAS